MAWLVFGFGSISEVVHSYILVNQNVNHLIVVNEKFPQCIFSHPGASPYVRLLV